MYILSAYIHIIYLLINVQYTSTKGTHREMIVDCALPVDNALHVDIALPVHSALPIDNALSVDSGLPMIVGFLSIMPFR